MNSKFVALESCTLFFVILLTGCGDSGPPSLADFNNTNIKKLRGAYGMFIVNHDLRGPVSEEEFKEYLKTSSDALVKLERMEITKDKIESIFVSERDGQPFKVRYGINGLTDHAIVFEAEGVDGKRFVAFFDPREVESDEYEKLWAGDYKAESGMNQLQ